MSKELLLTCFHALKFPVYSSSDEGITWAFLSSGERQKKNKQTNKKQQQLEAKEKDFNKKKGGGRVKTMT